MKVAETHPIQYLVLDHLVVNPILARRLPPAMARRYHALPVARSNGHITVAMANPQDNSARQAIAATLNAEIYAVQSDPASIDELLTTLWPEEQTQATLRLLVYGQDCPIAEQVQAYAHYLGDLLAGTLTHFKTVARSDPHFEALLQKASAGHDLLVYGEPDQSLLKRWFAGPPGCKAVKAIPISVLIVRQPCWPLRKILLVTRGQQLDDVAVDWIVRLAKPSKAAVTVLAVQPSISATDSQALSNYGVVSWLNSDTPLGKQLNRIARQLVNWDIEGILHFRQGLPRWQIRSEVSSGNYDLIVIAVDSSNVWLRRIPGELVSPLLRWVNRPVLIAKPVCA